MSRRLPLLRSYQLVRAGWSWNPSKRRPSGTGRPVPARGAGGAGRDGEREIPAAGHLRSGRASGLHGRLGGGHPAPGWLLRRGGAPEWAAAPDARDPEIMIVGFLAL